MINEDWEFQAPTGHGAHHFSECHLGAEDQTGDLMENNINTGFINFLYSYSPADTTFPNFAGAKG
jgi:hypothetical protein